jgi:hypothetical protein
MLSISHCGKLTSGGSAGIIGGGITIPGPGKTYTTWNPADHSANTSTSGNNLTATATSSAGMIRSTSGVSSGKWYWEFTTGMNGAYVGLTTLASSTTNAVGIDPNGYSYATSYGKVYHNNVNIATVPTIASGGIVGIALDMDAKTINFYKNGVLACTITGIPAGTYYPACSSGTGVGGTIGTANFGATAFSYSVPTGFNAGVYS